MIQSRRETLLGSEKALVLGFLLAALVAAGLLLTGRPAHASTTFTVTNTDDSGAGSLRQAIEDANATTGADTINFDIPGTGPHTIAPSSALPDITDPVAIDGYSQPGSKPNSLAVGNDALLKVELSGASAGSGANGLTIEATNSTVKGLIINSWNGDGVWVLGEANKVRGNFIGTDASGTQDLGNSSRGVFIDGAANNIVGGATAAARNIISGNDSRGVYLFGSGAKGNLVQGNYVGTDVSGAQDLGNSADGVAVTNASDNTVGGTTAGARNIISGNDNRGIWFIGAPDNKVQGNYIGTDASGTQDLGNSYDGVFIHGVPNTTNNMIGGTAAGARNIISGNDMGGVHIYASGATGNKVQGNYIGTNTDGTQDLGNYYGVFIEGAPDNTVGGTTAAARNIISGNDTQGIRIYGAGATGNKMQGNYIGTDASGTQDLGNSFYGVYIGGVPNNVVGGTTAGARNIISGNDGGGVEVNGSGATGNSILSNSIYSNGILNNMGIDLDPSIGPTANDEDDPATLEPDPDKDVGANDLQNYPEITSAKPTTKKKKKLTAIAGNLNSTPNQTFIVQLFSNPSGTDEGKTFIGQRSVTTDSSGNASFAIKVRRSVAPVGSAITATATDSGGNTSEFSDPPKTVG